MTGTTDAASGRAMPRLRASVEPERGGKIDSLVDVHGYEWLAPPIDRRPPPARPGARFVEADMCGWDECAPTVTPCRLPDGRELPDHGDLWDVAWRPDESGDGWRAVGRSLPYTLRRWIEPTADGLGVHYAVRTDEEGLPFLWAAHPQLRAPAGSRVLLDADTVVDALADREPRLVWADVDAIDSVPEGGCRKIYAEPTEPVSTVAVVVPGHGTLELSWDGSVVPYLGVWFDRGAFAREPVIAPEPSTGFFDSAAYALASGRVPRLVAGEELCWSITVRLR